MPRRQLVFIHVPKTAGTTLVKSVLEPNLDTLVTGSFRTLLSSPDRECVSGHFAYCSPRLLRRPVDYATMLREPIDRAVSYYYFVKDLVRTDLVERHPHRDYADSVTLQEFFENSAFSNLQARRVAGIEYDKAYPRLHRSKAFQRRVLDAAKRHLEAMPVFGLQDHFDESAKRLLDFIGGSVVAEPGKQAVTRKRLTVAEIAEFRPSALERLAAVHELDTELYRFAGELFEGRR